MGSSEFEPDKKVKPSLAFIVSSAIGCFFYRIGVFVSTNPWKTILFSWLVVSFCSLGFICFYNERDPMKLWIPEESTFLHDTKWLTSRFGEGTRVQSFLITAPNVLAPEILKKTLLIHDNVYKFTIKQSNGSVFSFEDLCFKIPIIAGFSNLRRRRRGKRSTSSKYNESRPFCPSVDMEPEVYCGIVNSLPTGCMQETLLDLWKFEVKELDQLTEFDIIEKLNETITSPYTGHETQYAHLLGGVEHDEYGRIISAKSLMSHYMLLVDYSQVDSSKMGNMAGTEDWASESTMLWESRFIREIQKLKQVLEKDNDNFTIYYSAGRSYGDISNAVMFQDMDKLMFGMLLMFVYMQLVLSKFGWTEIRVQLGSLGLLTVGMAFVCGSGICSILKISYGPVHTSLPFLLMGLGVDDIFVMMACYRKIQADTRYNEKSPEEKMGLMLQAAGASITVTSITDIIAFLVGAFTILPSLKSFCLYAAVSVFMTYFFVLTFFVAIFALDERRIAQRRNAFIPLIIHSVEKSNVCFQMNLMDRFLQHVYSKFILTKTGKIIIIMSVIGITSFNIQGLLHLRQKFDPSWFIPTKTYLGQFIDQTRQLYPDMGSEASVLIGKINYTEDMHSILTLYNEIQNQTDIVYQVHGWPESFESFVKTFHQKDAENLSDSDWRLYLSQFLYSKQGGKYQPNFRFEHKLKCGLPTPNVTVSQISFKFKKFYEREDYLPAKKRIEKLVIDARLDSGEGFSTVWGKIFGNWVTDEIIDEEIYRNIGLALIGVMACTALVIVNIQVCFWIFITVLLTLLNVGGCMARLGMTLDIVSCIALQLSVGLCVDYSAHIGHTFLTINQGSRTKRSLDTVLHIGAAVMYGGASTILALAVLANSEAYTYRSFFRIFFLVIIFGLFHGIVLLPVILSVLGPTPYDKIDKNKDAMTEHDREMEVISFIEKSQEQQPSNGYIPINLKI